MGFIFGLLVGFISGVIFHKKATAQVRDLASKVSKIANE